ncbi:LOW QUALITY PROTEIN: hypothetical protein PanWU01x14_290320 [Parasponia andersonii]|uniref:Uncharacterized protein n=1 Tax=Parasponia andersonii TaxID=3476 RepID=A0A2P5AXT8_PARAD|nr:LOW QUALITY PROTEIN: hypothetical protein PanWU01x14_290320 [Parasponia andersonii]
MNNRNKQGEITYSQYVDDIGRDILCSVRKHWNSFSNLSNYVSRSPLSSRAYPSTFSSSLRFFNDFFRFERYPFYANALSFMYSFEITTLSY